MRTYAIRLAETKKIVGAVRAENDVDLFDYVDEQANPHIYEYCKMPSDFPGGVIGDNRIGMWPAMDEKYWKTFEQLVGRPFPEWYAEIYIPSMPVPE